MSMDIPYGTKYVPCSTEVLNNCLKKKNSCTNINCKYIYSCKYIW